MALILTGKQLFTGEEHEEAYAACEACVRKLVHKIEHYKEELGNKPERDKHRQGTHQEIVPTREPDGDAVEQAARDGDYRAFRFHLLAFEEPLRKRIGRWVQRYPEAQGRINGDLALADLVEEVFLNAFEQFERRPRELPFHHWLEQLIDPSLKAVLRKPDEERENIEMIRSWKGAEEE